MSDSHRSPRLGLGLSEERKAALQQSNRLKQELYAQQKKIQFSNLLERSNDDVDAYIESQENVFIASGRKKKTEETENGGNAASGETSSQAEPQTEIENDDRDGFDFFYSRPYEPSSRRVRSQYEVQDEIAFDPAAPAQESLHDHLVGQIRMDGKYANLSPELKHLCETIIDRLDASGYLKTDETDASKQLSNAVAYPDYDENTELLVDEFDSLFGMTSTHEDRVRMKKALDDYFSPNDFSKFSRRLAREEFDSVVGRKTTKEEREKAKKLLDSFDLEPKSADPLDALFSHKPTPEERQLAEEALAVVQSLDPPGVGARDLRESLLLRLRPDNPHLNELRRIISDHFDDFCKKRIGALSEKTGISTSLLSQIYSESFPFFPAPEELYAANTAPTRWVQPEVVVEQAKNGRWTVRLDESRQDVELDPEYRKMLAAKRIDKQTREYLRRQYVEAQALLDALRNRNSTILRVAKAIVDFQEEFFADSFATPKPLTQQQIADKLGLDTSTISRACNDKWMATPRGTIPFKAFFPKAVSGDVTSTDVADVIRKIIDAEDKNKPYSDEEITSLLKKKYDISISRKTVQEHRDRLQIPNSRARKKKLHKE